MEINQELNIIIQAAFNEARYRHHEYLTPEHLLYCALFFESGSNAISGAGGHPDQLQNDLNDFLNSKVERLEQIPEPVQTLGFQSVVERAFAHVASAQKSEIDIYDMLVAIIDETDSHASYFLRRQGITRLALLEYISHEAAPAHEHTDTEKSSEKKSALELYTTDLLQKAQNGDIDPLIGREDVLERTMQVLCRRLKNNPLHVGEPGVGKTAITEGLARMIHEGSVPEQLAGSRIFALDLGSLLAGTKFRGDFENRMKQVISELLEIPQAILFIDEIHTIVGAGAVSGGSMDASNLLKPALASGKLRCIGSTTYDEFRKFFDRDRALSRRFQKIDIAEPSVEETVSILEGLRSAYEQFHNVSYTRDAIRAAAELSAKYINDRHLPDKAIDVLDEAASRLRLKSGFGKKLKIAPKDIEHTISLMARVPERSVSASETKQLLTIGDNLKQVIFGQNRAIDEVTAAIQRSRAGFGEDNRPVASFLFVGPTGVGKTELARQLAEHMGIHLHRFDMSEYQEKHTVARLIGAPPGYVGYEEGGLLTEAIRKNPHSVVLLDEIEKAHPDIFNTLLQVLDYATLTDNNGRKADFRNTIIIMTSNAGARDMARISAGFFASANTGAMSKAIEQFFSPEFRNRLDAIVTFNSIDRDMSLRIVQRELDLITKKMTERGIGIEYTPEAAEFIASHGFSEQFGARELKRSMQQLVRQPLSNIVLRHGKKRGSRISISANEEKLVFSLDGMEQSI